MIFALALTRLYSPEILICFETAIDMTWLRDMFFAPDRLIISTRNLPFKIDCFFFLETYILRTNNTFKNSLTKYSLYNFQIILHKP